VEIIRFFCRIARPSTIAAEREFNENIPLRVSEDGEASFAILPRGLSKIRSPCLSWKVANRIKRAICVFAKKHGSDFFEELLK
jgi:hypothetical protein